MDKTVIYKKLKEIMISEFKLDDNSIELDKHLSDDLQLDSLDMVDLIIRLSDYFGKKIEPIVFKDARTVQNLVDAITPFWKSDL